MRLTESDSKSAEAPKTSYRIGYLNPWRESAENQAFASLQIAARRLGHEFVSLPRSRVIKEVRPDFVIAVATAQPKMTDIPTFAVLHESRISLLAEEYRFRNLLTYDGFLTISDSLEQFAKDVNAGLGRSVNVGFYYNTPQISPLQSDVAALAKSRELRLCYFGTNWDRRSRSLFRSLSTRPYLRIHGPESSWAYLNGEGYFGATAFDGESVQNIYAQFGAGLMVLSREHLLDDVISNRIFEISSVGAVAVCPDTPWIRRNYGDSVYYYPAARPAREIAAHIDAVMADISAHPDEAADKAARAKAIFERSFAAERMIDSAVTYYERWLDQRATHSPLLVDVVIPVQSSSLPHLCDTLEAIDNQIAGKVRVILARDGTFDLDALGVSLQKAVVEVVMVDRFGEELPELLRAGLGEVRSEFFSITQPAERWLDHHLRSIAETLDVLPRDRALILSDCIDLFDDPEKPDGEDRRLHPFPSITSSIDILAQTVERYAFVASSALLRGGGHSPVDIADVLVGLLRIGEVGLTYRATVTRPWTHDTPERGAIDHSEQDVRHFLRLGPAAAEAQTRLRNPLHDYWKALVDRLRRASREKQKALSGNANFAAVEDGFATKSFRERTDLEVKQIPIVNDRLWGQPGAQILESATGPELIVPLPEPWAYCISYDLKGLVFDTPQWVVADLCDLTDTVCFGVVDQASQDYLEFNLVPPLEESLEVWLRVEPQRDMSFVIQASGTLPSRPVRLKGLWAVRDARDFEADCNRIPIAATGPITTDTAS